MVLATAPVAWCGGCQPPSMMIETFRGSGSTVLESLFRLGEENHVCLGIELAGEEIARLGVKLHAEHEPALEVVRRLLETTRHYQAVEQEGVIVIQDRRVHGFSLLDYRLHTFRVRQAPVQAVSNVLRMSLVRQLGPEVTGFAGSYRSGDVGDTVGPFAEVNRSIRDLLNLVVTGSRGGVWIARGGAITEGSLPEEPYWEILQFSSPREENLSRLRAVASELTQ